MGEHKVISNAKYQLNFKVKNMIYTRRDSLKKKDLPVAPNYSKKTSTTGPIRYFLRSLEAGQFLEENLNLTYIH
jgi:hypothetical protein